MILRPGVPSTKIMKMAISLYLYTVLFDAFFVALAHTFQTQNNKLCPLCEHLQESPDGPGMCIAILFHNAAKRQPFVLIRKIVTIELDTYRRVD